MLHNANGPEPLSSYDIGPSKARPKATTVEHCHTQRSPNGRDQLESASEVRYSSMPAHLILRNVVLLRFGTGLLVQSKQVHASSTPPAVFGCASKNSNLLSVKREHSCSRLSHFGHQSLSLYLCNNAGENLGAKALAKAPESDVPRAYRRNNPSYVPRADRTPFIHPTLSVFQN